MSGIDFLADTNALIYLLAGNPCMKHYISKKIGFSIISEMELLSFSGISHQEQNNIKAFLSECSELQLTKEVKEKTIEIRKHYRTKLPDAIIAATAIVSQIPLITADKAFEQIKELNLVLIKPVII